jgi:divalent metal cation (Fe/Co/Zn/Cd) transporter
VKSLRLTKRGPSTKRLWNLTESSTRRDQLVRRGLRLEYTTLSWNIIGVVILAMAAVLARSIALAGFGFDTLVEIGASTVVVWELKGINQDRERRALRLIGWSFILLVIYLVSLTSWALADHIRPEHSILGIVWTALTAALMFALALGKSQTGRSLGNKVLISEGRVTLIDALLATVVLFGLGMNALFSWWWADLAAGTVIIFYAVRECIEVFKSVQAS